MSDNTQKKKRKEARKQALLEQKMAEIQEIEQLQTISEDETDKEIQPQTAADQQEELDSPYDIDRPEYIQKVPKTSDKRISSAMNPKGNLNTTGQAKAIKTEAVDEYEAGHTPEIPDAFPTSNLHHENQSD